MRWHRSCTDGACLVKALEQLCIWSGVPKLMRRKPEVKVEMELVCGLVEFVDTGRPTQ